MGDLQMNTKPKKASNLAVLTAALAAACGTEITKVDNNFYGPNGEEITSSGSGNCDGFKDKHLTVAWNCNTGTVEPVGNDCSVRMETIGNKEVYVGHINGRTLALRGPELNLIAEFFERGQFTREDLDASMYVPESRERMTDMFECYFRQDRELRAVKYDRKPQIEARLDNIFRVSGNRILGAGVCPRQWYEACRLN